LWLIKVWFSASTFVVKIATFAKPETVSCKPVKSENNEMSSYQNFIRIGAYLPM
jgi:hypothetical protein